MQHEIIIKLVVPDEDLDPTLWNLESDMNDYPYTFSICSEALPPESEGSHGRED